MGDRCFCIFEGGGAKGIAHVGALAALEGSGLDLRGFAGTSAGAVVAALAAAGYRSSDIIHPAGSVLDDIDLDASNIWSGRPLVPARSPSRLFGRIGWLGILVARSGGVPALAATILTVLLAPPVLGWMFGWPAPYVALGEGAAIAAVFCLLAWLSRGLASLGCFERGLNQLLRLRLATRLDTHPAHRARLPDPVTFADMARAGCPPLRIVASDISSRALRLFSFETTPDAGVASAVAASVCLPVIFRPRVIDGRLYLDGGLVSNLPAWAFDAERALDRDAWTAVVEVGEAPRVSRPRGIGILGAAIATGFFGSGALNIRNVERLKSVRLKVDVAVLKFDPGLPLACKIVADAKRACAERLVYQLCDVPQQMTAICERIRLRAEEIVALALETEGKGPFAGQVRASIFVRNRDDRQSLTAEYQAGFANFPDERLRIPIKGSFGGQAVESGQPLYIEHDTPDWPSYLARPQDRWLRKAVWPAMRWALSTPYIKLPDGIEFVVSIDSDTYLGVEDDLVDITMASISEAVVTILDEYLPKEAFADVGS